MAPKGAKRASAAPAAPQNDSGKRQRGTGAAASGEGRNRGAAAGRPSQHRCTCRKCVDDWLSPTLKDALQQAASDVQDGLETAIGKLENEVDGDLLLRSDQVQDAIQEAAALQVLPAKTRRRMTLNFLKVYRELFAGIQEMLDEEELSTAPTEDVVKSDWWQGVEQLFLTTGESNLRKAHAKHAGCQREAVAYLLRQAIAWINAGEELEESEGSQQQDKPPKCANDDDYVNAAQRMLGVPARQARALLEREDGGSYGGSDSDGFEPEEEEYEDYEEEAADDSEDEDYEDFEEEGEEEEEDSEDEDDE